MLLELYSASSKFKESKLLKFFKNEYCCQELESEHFTQLESYQVSRS